jgi:hypothetical protein
MRQWQRPKKQAAFLTAYSACGNITEAARRAGLHRRRVYDWQEHDVPFSLAFNIAKEMAGDELEAEAWRRAVEGWDEPVYQNGKLAGYIRKKSDALLVLLLKAAKPEKYRERRDMTSDGKPFIQFVKSYSGINLDDLFGGSLTDDQKADLYVDPPP